SGERTESAGSDFGSEAMFMPYFMRALAAVQPERGPALVGPVRQMVVGSEIAETGYARLELKFDGAGRAVALFADDHLGLAVHERHVEHPFLVFRSTRAWLLVGEIIFLTIDEHHDVGVLLDRAGFAQVG